MTISAASPSPELPGLAGAGARHGDDGVHVGAAVGQELVLVDLGGELGHRAASSRVVVGACRRVVSSAVRRASGRRATVMLSCPPCALAQATSASAERRPARPRAPRRCCRTRCARGSPARSSSSTGRRSTPAPSPAVASSRRGRPRRVVRGVQAEPAGDGVRLRAVLGLAPAATPSGDLLGGPGVVDGQLPRVAVVGQPVGAAVADPPATSRAPSRTPATKVQDGGLSEPVGDVRGERPAALAASAALRRASRRPAASPGPEVVPMPRGVRGGEHVAGGAGSGQAGHVGVDGATTPRRTRPARRGSPARGRRRSPPRPRCGRAACRGRTPAATHGAGCSTKWSRGPTARLPQVSQ